MGFWLAAGYHYGPPLNPQGLRWSFIAMGYLPLQGTVPEAELAGATVLALVAKYLIQKRQRNWKEAEATMATINMRMRVTPSGGRFPIRTRLERTPFVTPLSAETRANTAAWLPSSSENDNVQLQ